MGGLIGVFGGTFDPPHLAHLILADEARHELALEKVLWVVTAQPPHKPGRPITPVEHRVEMVQRLMAADPAFELSRADLDRAPPHYAIGTLEWLRERFPETGFVYLMGADSLRDLPEWHRPQAFLTACEKLVVMVRTGVDVDLNEVEALVPGVRDKVYFLSVPSLEISSEDIRERVRAGRAFRYFLHPVVASYILDHGLYQ